MSPRRLNAPDDLGHARFVAVLGGADEVVVGDVQDVPQVAVAFDDPSARSMRFEPWAAADFSIFWPCSSVPVRNRTLWPSQPVVAGEDVGHHRRVDVADVGHVVDVVDRRRDVVGFQSTQFPPQKRAGRG